MNFSSRSVYAPSLALVFLLCFSACAGKQKTQTSPDTPATNGGKSTAAQKEIVFDETLIDRALLFGDADRRSVQVSPNGKTLAWLAPNDGVLNVWTAPMGAVEKAQALTAEKVRGVGHYYFAPDSKSVLFLRDEAGDENWQLFKVDLKKKKSVLLAGSEGVRTEVVGISPKNKRSIVVKSNKRDPKVFDLYTLTLRTKKMKLLEKNTKGFASYFVDASLKAKLAIKIDDEGGRKLLKKKGRKWVSFYEVSAEDSMPFSVLGFDARGRYVYLSDSTDRNTGAVYSVGLRSGKRKELFSDDKADIRRLYVHPKTRKIQGARVEYERPRFLFGKDAGFQEHIESLALLGAGSADVISRSYDDRKWVVGIEADDRPLEYFVYDTKDQTGEKLFSSRSKLEGVELASMKPVIIPSRDGLDLVSFLTLPKGVSLDESDKASESVPMVLWVHGGPWSRDRLRFNTVHQWLANRGYAVLSVNFRGSTGFGKSFVNAGDKEWGAKMHDDLLDAVKWATEHNITKEDTVAIAGGSYGGYATLAGLAFTPEAFACGVDIVGPSNLNTLLGTIPPYWSELMKMFKMRVGDPTTDEGKAFLKSRSPVTQADKIVRPLLIGQGKNDPRVKQAESDQIVKAMSDKNIPVTYVLYDDEGHGFRREANRLSFFALTEVFLAQCLGGKTAPYNFDGFQTTSMQVKAGADQISGLKDVLARLDKSNEEGGDGGVEVEKAAEAKAEEAKAEEAKAEEAKAEEAKAEEKKAEEKKAEEKEAEEKKAEEKKAEEKKAEEKKEKSPAKKASGGLKPGAQVKLFKLPVLNAETAQLNRWGPAHYMNGGKEAKKLFLMSFFATWCEPCKKEMPELVRLFEKYKDQGLGIALVDIEKDDAEGTKRKAALELVTKNKVTFPVVHDRFQVVGRRYEAATLPYLLIVDAEGVIQQSHVGYTDEIKEGLEAEIRKGLGLPATE